MRDVFHKRMKKKKFVKDNLNGSEDFPVQVAENAVSLDSFTSAGSMKKHDLIK